MISRNINNEIKILLFKLHGKQLAHKQEYTFALIYNRLGTLASTRT